MRFPLSQQYLGHYWVIKFLTQDFRDQASPNTQLISQCKSAITLSQVYSLYGIPLSNNLVISYNSASFPYFPLTICYTCGTVIKIPERISNWNLMVPNCADCNSEIPAYHPSLELACGAIQAIIRKLTIRNQEKFIQQLEALYGQ